jgi:hypothetical protein
MLDFGCRAARAIVRTVTFLYLAFVPARLDGRQESLDFLYLSALAMVLPHRIELCGSTSFSFGFRDFPDWAVVDNGAKHVTDRHDSTERDGSYRDSLGKCSRDVRRDAVARQGAQCVHEHH